MDCCCTGFSLSTIVDINEKEMTLKDFLYPHHPHVLLDSKLNIVDRQNVNSKLLIPKGFNFRLAVETTRLRLI